jgi:hypothetical protein
MAASGSANNLKILVAVVWSSSFLGYQRANARPRGFFLSDAS